MSLCRCVVAVSLFVCLFVCLFVRSFVCLDIIEDVDIAGFVDCLLVRGGVGVEPSIVGHQLLGRAGGRMHGRKVQARQGEARRGETSRTVDTAGLMSAAFSVIKW